ncbi:MAG: AAA family ATPase [Deltaproteobacteria bacterium]|nr:AAA family ATPase [Deltaproteobacteria bacterium]
MKILGVRFKNLNSLTGEWQVDFTHPDYASDGIFAITGPTGSGKTTILDAVCLGLYGRTPRLDKVTKSSNEIMSRQAGECFAEVDFETQKGRFRCHWSQHRARKRHDGELQPARHEIAADSGVVLESGITQVGEFIEKVTGMDFERFTRSMLLAQGGFAVFLQAGSDARAPILEQITGTEIYSLISMKVHERRTEERTRLDILKSELSVIQILGGDAEQELQNNLAAMQRKEAELGREGESLRQAANWIEGLTALEKELADLNRQGLDWEQRQAAFAPEARRLAKSRQALALEGDYRSVLNLRTQQDDEKKELDAAVVRFSESEQAGTNARVIKNTAETRLAEARNEQSAAAEIIRKTREIDTRLREMKKQGEEKEKALQEGEKRELEHGRRLEKGGEELKKAQQDLEAVHEYRQAHASDAGLIANLTAIRRGFVSLREIAARHESTCKEIALKATNREAIHAERRKSEGAYEKTCREFEERQSTVNLLTAQLDEILQGRELNQWHNERNNLKERELALVKTVEIVTRMETIHESISGVAKELAEKKVRQGMLAIEIKAAMDKKSLMEERIVDLEARAALQNRIRSLEEDRKRLIDGRPCPLCGATEHPYAQGNIPELNATETELKKAKAELGMLTKRLSEEEAEQIKTAAAIEHGEKDQAEKLAALAGDEKRCAESLSDLHLPVAAEQRVEVLNDQLAGLKENMGRIAALISAAEEKSKKGQAAQKDMEKIQAKLDAAGKARQEAQHKLETADREQERLLLEGAAQKEQLDQVQAVAQRDVEPFGIKELPISSLEAILDGLTRRQKTWQDMEVRQTVGEKRIQEIKGEIDREIALLESLEGELATRRKDRDEGAAAYAALLSSRREIFGDRNPDVEEQKLAATVDHAGRYMEQASEKNVRIEKEIIVLKEKIGGLKERTEKRDVELTGAGERLAERISRAGFADEQDYVLSCLPEEAREKLAEREKSLIREKTELEARQRDKAAALAAAREKCLTDQPLETLRENISSCDGNLKQIRLEIGGIIKTLQDNESLKKKQQERLRQLDAQKTECLRWDTLHQLIGSADGKKFRNFAQGLTFEMMISHANRQLRKMTDRYLLLRDVVQPLELNVIDNYQAGEIRSTKNLSGGESFLVSLALALGLSQMASRNVRVDSLFLDEGFGTLDEDALETALETLASLRRDGKLIGVISHVAALKDRISAQIQVIPETGGRSRIAGPGCRRIS